MMKFKKINLMAVSGICWGTEREGSYYHSLGIRYKDLDEYSHIANGIQKGIKANQYKGGRDGTW